ncbi:thermonuclease family protein [Sphingomonas sp. PP-CC-3A-396]|uniref:thermonuclease family protein n=1 Tax=Sphingomonas sp. PP-CC-3A-396 TaxID=2135655 RepID=UPI001FB65DFD|nr:thermonuclease family protein [Sphingomonas sp. PP-CC-3A-396]
MRLLSGDRAGATRRGGSSRGAAPGVLLQLRLVFYGVLLGLMMPVIRQIDWSALVPPGLKIEWPTGFGIAWPAGHLRVPGGWGWGADAAKAEASAAAAGAATTTGAATTATGALATAAGVASAATTVAAAASALSGGKAVSARFTICGHAKRIDCMVDGDTFWMAGTKIRIADIDTPETHPPRCAREARLGQAATLKMQALLNAGPFTLTPIKRDVDRYGRKLRIVERGGVSLGAVLVRHGLARRYGGGKRSPWCGWGSA